jgi:simple sugar transport system permease protein
MPFTLEARPQPSLPMLVATPFIAIALTLLSGAVLFSSIGISLGAVFYAFFVSPVATLNGVAELLLKASPIILIAIGLSIGFLANVWNIGAEGQLALGAIAGTALALKFHDAGSHLLLVAMLLAGICGGMLWAAIPALLRTLANANEILVSLMLNYVALLILSYLVYGPWKDPYGYNFPQTVLFSPNAMLPILVDGTRLNASILMTATAVVAAWFFINKTFLGFQMRVVGLAPRAARYAGYSTQRAVLIGMLAGGGAAGFAGVAEVAGPLGQLLPSVSPGYGFTAIIVAFVGRLNPFAIVPAGLLIALLHLGGDAAQIDLGLPSAVVGLFQGVLLLFLLGTDVLVKYRIGFARASLSAD